MNLRYKNGKDILDAETKKVGDNKFQLLIRSASIEDAGDYEVSDNLPETSFDSIIIINQENVSFHSSSEEF